MLLSSFTTVILNDSEFIRLINLPKFSSNRYLRRVLNLYLSVLFYAVVQLNLFIVITYFTASGMMTDVKGTTSEEALGLCKVKSSVETYSIILPGYAVLLLTVTRFIIIRYPMNFIEYLKKRYQFVLIFFVMAIPLAITILPHLGLCDINVGEKFSDPTTKSNVSLRYCRYQNCNWTEVCADDNCTGENGWLCAKDYGIVLDENNMTQDGFLPRLGKGCYLSVEAEICNPTSNCITFFTLLISIGFLLPVILVIFLYYLIYTSIKAHQQTQKDMSHHALLTKVYSDRLSSDESGEQEKAKTRKLIRNISNEGKKIPWSILFILCLHICSAIPWVPMELNPTMFIEGQGFSMFLLDICYFILIISLSISPMVYLMTSMTLKHLMFKSMRHLPEKFLGIKRK